jgi:hypothetical protein
MQYFPGENLWSLNSAVKLNCFDITSRGSHAFCKTSSSFPKSQSSNFDPVHRTMIICSHSPRKSNTYGNTPFHLSLPFTSSLTIFRFWTQLPCLPVSSSRTPMCDPTLDRNAPEYYLPNPSSRTCKILWYIEGCKLGGCWSELRADSRR